MLFKVVTQRSAPELNDIRLFLSLNYYSYTHLLAQSGTVELLSSVSHQTVSQMYYLVHLMENPLYNPGKIFSRGKRNLRFILFLLAGFKGFILKTYDCLKVFRKYSVENQVHYNLPRTVSFDILIRLQFSSVLVSFS